MPIMTLSGFSRKIRGILNKFSIALKMTCPAKPLFPERVGDNQVLSLGKEKIEKEGIPWAPAE